jgi:small subunit ribosomal protein S21
MKEQFKKNKRNSKKVVKGGDTFKPDVAVTPSEFAHIEPVQAKPLEVIVYNNNFDKAIRAFRALVQKERILSSYKERQTYEKPSDKRRRKRNEAKRKSLDFNDDLVRKTSRVKTKDSE